MNCLIVYNYTQFIQDNIKAAKKCGACDTVIPATDTIVESRDGKIIKNIPNIKQ